MANKRETPTQKYKNEAAAITTRKTTAAEKAKINKIISKVNSSKKK